MLESPQTATPPPGAFAGELLDFQKQGLAFLLAARRCLLADEMGLGKTVQALAFLATTAAYPAILVVPPHLIRNWQRELQRFLSPDGQLRVHVIRGLTPYKLPEADVYIIHYLLLRGWKEVLPEQGFRTVIFDEMQELRRNGTGKYSAASLLSQSCENVIGLSGTPIYNQAARSGTLSTSSTFTVWATGRAFPRVVLRLQFRRGAKPELLGEHLRAKG